MKQSLLKFYKHILLLTFALLVGGIIKVEGADRYSVASGNWNATSTWSAKSGGAAGVSFPVAGDNVTIEDGDIVNVNITDAECANLNIGGGGNWTNSVLFFNNNI